MESYSIQHNFLFSSGEVAEAGPAIFDVPVSKTERMKSIPVRASSILSRNGKEMLEAFASFQKPVFLINDLPKEDNPVLLAYSSILLKGIVGEFHKLGVKVFC